MNSTIAYILTLIFAVRYVSCSELNQSTTSISPDLDVMSSKNLDKYLSNFRAEPENLFSFVNTSRFFRRFGPYASSSNKWKYNSPPNDPEIMQQHNLIGYLHSVARKGDPNHHIPVIMKYIEDWKMTRYSTNSSVLSVINTYLREQFLGKLNHSEYLTIFRPFYSNNRLYINDIATYLYALALFTVDIQNEIVHRYMVNFPKYKNSLLHYVIIFGLSEDTIIFMIESGAQVHVDAEGLSYNNQFDSTNLFLSFKEFKPCIEGGNFNNPETPEEAFVRGMYNSKSDKFRSGSLRNSFHYYSPKLTMKLIEMAPDQKLAKLHLAQLLSLNPSKHSFYPKIEELVDPKMLISRLRQGIPDAIAIAMLSQCSHDLGSDQNQLLEIISEFVSNTVIVPLSDQQKSYLIKFTWEEYDEPISRTTPEFEDEFGFKAVPLSYFTDILFIAKINDLNPEAFELLRKECSDQYVDNVINWGYHTTENNI